MNSSEYTIKHKTPSVAEYCRMRRVVGLSPKTEESASIGLPNSLFAVSVRDKSGALFAMGRLVGDGGCFIQVCDIAVQPHCQGNGLGRKVMQELTDYIDRAIPAGAFVNLFADGTASELYKEFGFGETAPKSVGMAKYSQ